MHLIKLALLYLHHLSSFLYYSRIHTPHTYTHHFILFWAASTRQPHTLTTSFCLHTYHTMYFTQPQAVTQTASQAQQDLLTQLCSLSHRQPHKHHHKHSKRGRHKRGVRAEALEKPGTAAYFKLLLQRVTSQVRDSLDLELHFLCKKRAQLCRQEEK
jgi:hypothetical protein